MAAPLNPNSQVVNLRVDNQAENEQSLISPVADAGVKGINTVTCVAFASTAQGDWVQLNNQAGGKMGFWLDKDANGTSPAGLLFVALDHSTLCGIATGDTAVQVAAKVKAALIADASFVGFTIVDNLDGTLTFTATKYGALTAPARHNSAENGNGSFVVAATNAGTNSQHISKYLTIRDKDNNKFHAWCNPDSQGSDPAPASSTAIAVAFAGGASAATIAAALVAAIDAQAAFEANLKGTDQVQVRVVGNGNPTNIADVDTAWSVSTVRSGVAGFGLNPSDSPSSISNNPSAV